ncbi:MAG: AEC family transporter [Desulfobacterales bacterium]|nr:AEC family transporter [Desulfobacterales bacterium]
MEFLVTFNSSILPIFIIVGIAFVYNRLVRPDIQQLTNMTLNVFAPIFLFDALVRNKIVLDMVLKPMIFMVLLTGALMIMAYLVAGIIKANENERVSLVLASSMINVGNFGLPLIYFAFGKGAEAYSMLYFTAFNIPLCTVAIYISSREKNIRNILIDVAKIPIFHAMVVALAVTGMNVEVPEAIGKGMELIGQATIPLLIFILGLQLSNIEFKIGYIRIIIIAVCMRLIVSPAIAGPILDFLGVSTLEQQVAVIQTSTPAALLPLMYAIRFNRSPDLLAAIILATTILSGVSLTFLIRLMAS